MPIVELNASDLLQRCTSCDGENRLALSLLEAGTGTGTQVDPRVIRLPSCAHCGSVEFLIRSGEEESERAAPGSLGHLHRLLVDHLHAGLVEDGRVHAVLKEQSDSQSRLQKASPPDELGRWFPNGLKIDWPRKEGARDG